MSSRPPIERIFRASCLSLFHLAVCPKWLNDARPQAFPQWLSLSSVVLLTAEKWKMYRYWSAYFSMLFMGSGGGWGNHHWRQCQQSEYAQQASKGLVWGDEIFYLFATQYEVMGRVSLPLLAPWLKLCLDFRLGNARLLWRHPKRFWLCSRWMSPALRATSYYESISLFLWSFGAS
jgi:hypothetical protein